MRLTFKREQRTTKPILKGIVEAEEGLCLKTQGVNYVFKVRRGVVFIGANGCKLFGLHASTYIYIKRHVHE